MKNIAFIRKVENATVVRSIREGLVSIIPVLIIGALTLVLKSFPIDAYQTFIATFADGFLLLVFNLVYSATFGVLSLYMTISISRSYMRVKADPDSVHFGAILSAVLSFFIVSGAYLEGFGTDSMGPKSMFLAILTGLGASWIYRIFERFLRRRRIILFSAGANRSFNRMLTTIAPIAATAAIFSLINGVIISVFDVDSLRMLLIKLFNQLFSYGSIDFFKGLFFVFLASVLWFFGIHGSDTLEDVMQNYFAPGLAANQAAVAAGGTPNVILTKEFFDCFVLMGGCGSAICLLIALLLFSRNRAHRSLSLTAAFPMLFNINELMVFGLPIIFNPIMLIPFLAVPMVCYSVAYLALSTGLVPLITGEVAWTTPVILGGLKATGSVAGAILQVVNIALGVLIYTPFVRLFDRRMEDEAKLSFASFLDFFKKNESSLASVNLIEMNDTNGDMAKRLCAELKTWIAKKNITIAYQPLYSYEGKCVGAEALLRWKHPLHGMIYPPLVIKLAEDGGILADLEEAIVRQVLSDRTEALRELGEDIKISFNVTGTTVVTPRFLQFCRELNEEDPFRGKKLCLEVTEQSALNFDENTEKAFSELREMGLLLAIDDFSMGQTSLQYLKENTFDIIKLDGSLVKGLSAGNNCREIISSIVQLASTLRLEVIAEFVETEAERDMLHEIGCDTYQGYLYAKPIFLPEKPAVKQ
ncbi:MAG: PTS sugar transporter subunit IIC/EAL domain-containing protein [Clostridia bacterium]|nr:PTS sugar transporter subunit IIC/EAL domain-containing protein [Clostridia bacterium]